MDSSFKNAVEGVRYAEMRMSIAEKGRHIVQARVHLARKSRWLQASGKTASEALTELHQTVEVWANGRG